VLSSEAGTESPLPPASFIEQFDAAATAAGFERDTFGTIQTFALNAYRKGNADLSPRIYLSSGMHGDEPAPPWALLELMRENFFSDRVSWFICPLLNPTGFTLRTRENHAGIDLNRDYRNPVSSEVAAHISWLQRQPTFDLALCLHEDWEATGYYLYELNPEQRPTLAEAFIAGAITVSPIDQNAIIDGRPINLPGIIRPDGDLLLQEKWPEAFYLHKFHSPFNYTLETTSAQPLEQRIATHMAALRLALAEFLRT
jgi:protein MpaA